MKTEKGYFCYKVIIKTFIPCQNWYAILCAYNLISIFCRKQLEMTNQTGVQIKICIIHLPILVRLSKTVQRNASFMIHNFRKTLPTSGFSK